MAYSEAQILTKIQTALNDSTTAVWSTATIHRYMRDALVEVADYIPNVVLATATTPSGTAEVDISGISNLIEILYVEYEPDKEPRRFRNFTRKADLITLDVTTSPDANDEVRLYCNKPHDLYGSTSTFDPHVEPLFVDLVASRLAIDYGVDKINSVNVGGARTWQDFVAWGERKLDRTIKQLKRLKPVEIEQQWGRDA